MVCVPRTVSEKLCKCEEVQVMKNIGFDYTKDISYHWSGTFVAPGSNWIHMTRRLSDYELMFVTEGTLYIASGDDEYTVEKGEYLLMPPTENQHGTKKQYCSFYWMHFSYNNEKNDHVTSETGDTVTDVQPSDSGLISLPIKGCPSSPDRLIVLLKQLQDSDRRYRSAALNHYLTGAVLTELSLQNGANAGHGLRFSREQTYSDILTYIDWHISEPLHIDELAAYFGYNSKYLTTFFKKRSGIPLKQYIIRTKMERAKSLLSESSLPVSQIAYQLGFTDAHNFSNAFRTATGMSPGRYRESYNRHSRFNV